MTNWMPQITGDGTPRYIAIADSMARDIDASVLKPGDKLPPQRNLAFDLGVTIGTISRAYALARERGLVAGEVGRGTYVLDRDALLQEANGHAQAPAAPAQNAAGNLLRMTSTSAPDIGQAALMARYFAEIMAQDPRAGIDYVRTVPESWREAGAQWLATGGWTPKAATIVPTMGVQAGLMSVLAAISAPGDRIAFEDLTYLATVRGSSMMGRRVARLRSNEDGIDPEDFEKVCAQQHPKAVVLVATLNNPTLSTMSLENRMRIADIAHRYNVWLIEDNIYGGLKNDAPATFAEIAPAQTFHLNGLSKSVAAGLRTGWVACPPGYETRVLNAHRMTTGGAAYAMKEMAARMVLDGEAARIRDTVRAITADRVALARSLLPHAEFRSDPDCPFLWLTLPDPWLPGTFRNAAMAEGIVVDVADEFKVAQLDYGLPRVRVSLTGLLGPSDVRAGLAGIGRLLQMDALAYDYQE